MFPGWSPERAGRAIRLWFPVATGRVPARDHSPALTPRLVVLPRQSGLAPLLGIDPRDRPRCATPGVPGVAACPGQVGAERPALSPGNSESWWARRPRQCRE